ncbi:MAG: 3-dehydroquinate synthase [Bacteroidota bacterium]
MSIPNNVFLNADSSERLNEIIAGGSFDKIAVLVDENTYQHCWPNLALEGPADIIGISSGEKAKNLTTCEYIWKEMTDLKLSRRSLLVNLGGGVIGDMGGFVASTYKRGISFVNVPTTLLAQVDASIGGKLGIDFHGLKNHIGVFQEPLAVLVDTQYLKTLEERELRSGYAEMLKHGLINNASHWAELASAPFSPDRNWSRLMPTSVHVKGEVVAEDPREHGLRKILNFGHTLGHAIETYFLSTKDRMLHGEAIALGMVLEAYLSQSAHGLSKASLDEVSNYLIATYGKHVLPPLPNVLELMQHDKKNEQGKTLFSLLKNIGDCAWDQQVSQGQIEAAFDYYENLNE